MVYIAQMFRLQIYRTVFRYITARRPELLKDNLTSLCCPKHNEINIRYSDEHNYFVIKNSISIISIFCTITQKLL